MKKIIVPIAALLLTALFALALASCATFKVPEDTTTAETDPAETTKPSGGTTQVKVPMMNLLDADLTSYVKLGSFENLKVKVSVNVTDKQVEEQLDEFVKSSGMFDAEAVTKAGDTVVINYIGRINDVAFEGGTGNNQKITLAENNGYIPGFDKDLYGVKVGTKVFTDVTFPENYHNAEFVGKAATFEITVVGVEGQYALTDAGVETATNGKYKTIAEYSAYLRDAMITENIKNYDNILSEAIITALNGVSEIISLPKEHVDYYVSDILAYYEATYDYYATMYQIYYGISSFAEFRDFVGITDEGINDAATLCVTEDLLLISCAKALGLATVSDEDFRTMVAKYVEEMNYESSAALLEATGEVYLKTIIVKDRVMEYLKENSDIVSDYDDFKHLIETTTAPETEKTPDPEVTTAG